MTFFEALHECIVNGKAVSINPDTYHVYIPQINCLMYVAYGKIDMSLFNNKDVFSKDWEIVEPLRPSNCYPFAK